jgi:hypothetical protein
MALNPKLMLSLREDCCVYDIESKKFESKHSIIMYLWKLPSHQKRLYLELLSFPALEIVTFSVKTTWISKLRVGSTSFENKESNGKNQTSQPLLVRLSSF